MEHKCANRAEVRDYIYRGYRDADSWRHPGYLYQPSDCRECWNLYQEVRRESESEFWAKLKKFGLEFVTKELFSELPTRVQNRLGNLTLVELVCLTEAEFLRKRDLGRKSMKIVKGALSCRGLALGHTPKLLPESLQKFLAREARRNPQRRESH